tara:strand:+ start:2344 stop:2658 length:315 start_codon:yes stop_codon:yes gene_type:complete
MKTINATLKNLRMYETSCGIAWKAEIKTIIHNKEIIIPIENDGRGGISKICDFSAEQRRATATLREWANNHIPNDSTALETICELTDSNELLTMGLIRLTTLQA